MPLILERPVRTFLACYDPSFEAVTHGHRGFLNRNDRDLSSWFTGRDGVQGDRPSRRKASVRNAVAEATDKPFPCPRCGRRYKRKDSVTTHLRFECGILPQFTCPVCQHKVSHRRYIQKHIARKHPDYVEEFHNNINNIFSD